MASVTGLVTGSLSVGSLPTLAADPLAGRFRTGHPGVLVDLAAPARPADGRDQLPGALVAPVRSGVLLTGADLRAAAEVAGLGCRVGERRYTLQAMLDQDASATLGWLGNHARQQAALHAAGQPIGGPDHRHWWIRRALRTARTLQRLRPARGRGPRRRSAREPLHLPLSTTARGRRCRMVAGDGCRCRPAAGGYGRWWLAEAGWACAAAGPGVPPRARRWVRQNQAAPARATAWRLWPSLPLSYARVGFAGL